MQTFNVSPITSFFDRYVYFVKKCQKVTETISWGRL